MKFLQEMVIQSRMLNVLLSVFCCSSRSPLRSLQYPKYIIYIHICVYICMYVCMYICMYVYICMYIYTYIYIYIYIFSPSFLFHFVKMFAYNLFSVFTFGQTHIL